jgi:hypothetical protein
MNLEAHQKPLWHAGLQAKLKWIENPDTEGGEVGNIARDQGKPFD